LPIYTTQKPYYVNFPVPQNDAAPAQHNILHERYDGIDIHDIRGNEDAFKIDTHGFQLVRDSTSMSNDDFEQDSIIRQRYYPEIISLVTKTLGATRVVPFEHTVSQSYDLCALYNIGIRSWYYASIVYPDPISAGVGATERENLL
jgi:hypothetical protein